MAPVLVKVIRRASGLTDKGRLRRARQDRIGCRGAEASAVSRGEGETIESGSPLAVVGVDSRPQRQSRSLEMEGSGR